MSKYLHCFGVKGQFLVNVCLAIVIGHLFLPPPAPSSDAWAFPAATLGATAPFWWDQLYLQGFVHQGSESEFTQSLWRTFIFKQKSFGLIRVQNRMVGKSERT